MCSGLLHNYSTLGQFRRKNSCNFDQLPVLRCLLIALYAAFNSNYLMFSTQFIIFEPYYQCCLTWERKIESSLHLPALLVILQKHNGVNHKHVLCYKNYSS